MTFHDNLQNNNRIPFLYSVTPPRADAAPDRQQLAAARLTRRANALPLDGLVIYDVQSEQDRTTEPRPFLYRPTIDPRAYAQHLHGELAAPIIAYKCIAGMREWEWERWLCEAGKAGVEAVSVVGLASAKAKPTGLSLPRALELASEYAPHLALGGVVIPERHTGANSECDRLLRKSELGCDYFISQAIYDPELTIQLLRDYARDCDETGAAPRRIFLTFAPCGSEKTLEFMKWLGVQIPESVTRRISALGAPLAESVEICVENFRRIQQAVEGLAIPIGVNVESVSTKKDEIECAVALSHELYGATRESVGALHCGVTAQKP